MACSTRAAAEWHVGDPGALIDGFSRQATSARRGGSEHFSEPRGPERPVQRLASKLFVFLFQGHSEHFAKFALSNACH